MERKIIQKIKECNSDLHYFRRQLHKLNYACPKLSLSTLDELWRISHTHVFGQELLSILFSQENALKVAQADNRSWLEHKFLAESDPLNHHYPTSFLHYLLSTSELPNVLKKEVIDKVVEQDSYLTFALVKLQQIKDTDRVTAIFSAIVDAASVEKIFRNIDIINSTIALLNQKEQIIVQNVLLHKMRAVKLRNLGDISMQIVAIKFCEERVSTNHVFALILLNWSLEYHDTPTVNELLINSIHSISSQEDIVKVTSSIVMDFLMKVPNQLPFHLRTQYRGDITQWANKLRNLDATELLSYSHLNQFMPIIKLISNNDEQHYLSIARVMMAKPYPNRIDIYTLQFALKQPISPQTFIKTCESVLSNQKNPNLSDIKIELNSFLSHATLADYSNLVTVLMQTSAKASLKRNIKYIEYLIIKLYRLGSDSRNQAIILNSLSLYCDFCLTLLDNKYFDRFRELAELEIATNSDISYITQIFLVFKRISSSTSTEYSEKLLDLTELALSRLIIKVQEQTPEQLRLSTVCLSIVTDLVAVNQILEHQLTNTIMIKKYANLFRSLESIINSSYPQFYEPIISEYARYLGGSRFELDELELEDKLYDVARMYAQMSQGQQGIQEVFAVLRYVNQIVFEKLLGKGGSQGVIEISKVLDYMMDQGLQYEVVRLQEAVLKAQVQTAKITEETALDEKYASLFRTLFTEQQVKLRDKLLSILDSLKDPQAHQALQQAMFTYDLRQKAEGRQLRNVDFKSPSTGSTLENCRSKIVMLAKDQMNPKKSMGFTFVFIPQMFIEIFDTESIDKSKVKLMLDSLTLVQPKELMKIGEGSYLTLFAQICHHLNIQGTVTLLEKISILDNQTMQFVLKTDVQPSPLLLKKVFVDLVKHYAMKDEAGPYIASTMKNLASKDVSILAQGLRDLQKQVTQGKLQMAHIEKIQKITQSERIHQSLLANKALSQVDLGILVSEIFSLLKIQLGKLQNLRSENFILQLVSLVQSTVWDQVYDSKNIVNINSLVKELLATIEEAKQMNQVEITQSLGGFSLAFCLRDKQENTYSQLMSALQNTHYDNQHFLKVLSICHILRPHLSNLDNNENLLSLSVSLVQDCCLI